MQKVRELALIQVSRIKYLQSSAILVLFIEKVNIKKLLKKLLKKYINKLIKVAKIIDMTIIRAKILEYWHYF